MSFATKSPELPEWDYTVHLLEVTSMRAEPVEVVAAYFQEQGSMLLFKDAEHMVVEAFRTELVTRIARGDESVDVA